MHEIAVIEAVLEQVRRFTPAKSQLAKVRLDVGALEHLDPDAMRLAWQAATADTDYATAELVINRVPVRIRCRTCRQEYEPEDVSILYCSECGSSRPEVLAGTGVMLRSLEVEAALVHAGN